jgi:transcriptional regulator with XRE-family HTH domain
MYNSLMPQPRKRPQPATDPTSEAIGSRIKQCRIKRGLSQAELADQIGVSREAIAAYETGRIHLLDDMIARTARALAVTADELLGLKDIHDTGDVPQLRLTRRLKLIEKLPMSEQKALIKTIDAYLKSAESTE